MNAPLTVRNPCPPGACDCEWERLDAPDADRRVLLLTRDEERRLLERLERVTSLNDLEHVLYKVAEQLGVYVGVEPGVNEVRTMRGINIVVQHKTGLCRKTRQSIPTAIRRALEANPQIAWQLLNANDLLRDA
ncbi:hypothetical protein G7013_02770 [Pseudomonas viridiflava]|uniref:Ribosomal protein S3AE n=1 Tax=Pseudomonas viridiflava TaxID=33069 RepID=A0A3M5PI05_PSEVI|nr:MULTISPECIES: hypothetical protein [Pseudomonas syringae group]MBA1228572.1 hypothetical protein [Pseudomonas viridiflava]MCF5705784.1 hypothetical protein [Pseudomonas syringae]RMT84220.1 hypothetical protein ALP40_02608 [Pseudomonas viridiflava]